MRILDLLLIASLALFWYGLVPVAGAFYNRRAWRRFRRRYDTLRLRPVLDYAASRSGQEGDYRFTGAFESLETGVRGERILWIRNADLTVPVALERAETFVLPESDGDRAAYEPGTEMPRKIRWGELVGLSGGAKVYVGGRLLARDGRPVFVSRRESPLLLVFYDGEDASLTRRVIRAGRQGNEYWNALTPYALALGVFSLFLVMLNYIQRPAFQPAARAAVAALCLPLYPVIPPAFLFTVLYRRLWWQARLFRVWRDLARLPLRYLGGEGRALLPDGGEYLAILCQENAALREKMADGDIPLIVPERALSRARAAKRPERRVWYLCGAPGDGTALPGPPRDPQAVWGAIPGEPERLARSFTRRAYLLETLACLSLFLGLALNVFCVILIFRLFSGL